MKVMVTGGAGFIGSHIVEELLNQGHVVSVLDNLTSGKRGKLPGDIPFYHYDLGRDLAELEAIFSEEKPDVVIHHAAQVSVNHSLDHPIQDLETNTLGTLHLLQCCKTYNVKKIIFASSAAVYGNTEKDSVESDGNEPLSFYGLSKLTAEKYIKLYGDLYGLNYTILRYANVYGPGQNAEGESGVISLFCEALRSGGKFTVYGDGNQTRDFVYVKDVARANVLALTKADKDVLNISSATTTSVLEVLQSLRTLTGETIRPVFLGNKKGEIRHSLLKNNRAAEALGWIPHYSLLEGLKETIECVPESAVYQEL
ncbi:NAD-dependent epimerase/dehydratase family protein [Fictibacillus nanhaiensis]|nr:NAD-dependent epimerase/dehydratase family protein [Fictibacillus nanhaiensis]